MNLVKTQNNLTSKEYRALPQLSSSDLRLFNQDRKKFYKTRILGEKQQEEYNKSMLIGSLVHCLLLEDQATFDSRYHLSTLNGMPTGLMLTFVEALWKHTKANLGESGEMTMEFSDIAKLAFDESGFKWAFETVLTKFSGSKAEEYYRELIETESRGLKVVTLGDITIAEKIANIVKNDQFCGKFFDERTKFINEMQIDDFEIDGLKMKGMLDKVVIDEEAKTIRWIDLKVVFSNETFITEYYLKRAGFIPSYIYQAALRSLKEYEEYTLLPPIFLAIDSGCFNAPIQYELTEQDLHYAYWGFKIGNRQYKGVKEIIKSIEFATENQKWDISYENYKNEGKTPLSITYEI